MTSIFQVTSHQGNLRHLDMSGVLYRSQQNVKEMANCQRNVRENFLSGKTVLLTLFLGQDQCLLYQLTQ